MNKAKEKYVRGKCDYCHKSRMVSTETQFCRECFEHFNCVTNKYFDGNILAPLKAAANVMKPGSFK